MKKGKVIEFKETIQMKVECPNCEDKHQLNITRSDSNMNELKLHCFGCTDDFIVVLGDYEFSRITKQDLRVG